MDSPQELNIPDIDTDAEAALAFQSNGAAGLDMRDPMAEAIERELGQSLSAGSLGLAENGMTELPEVPEANEVFRCVNLTKAYGAGSSYIEVIKGITFNVKRGEYIVIYGPSGSGKSTMLHLLSGLETPTRGEIRIRNHSIQKFTDEELSQYHREEIGLVFQSFNLLESLRVWENVAFPLMLAGAPLEWRRHEALKMLERFAMLDFANHFPNQLSGGQQQRVALARALVHDPELLLIDEPTGNLDSRSSALVIAEIQRLHAQENRTIILVTHSQEFLPYATRIFYIKDGTLRTSAPIEEGGANE